MKFPEWIGVGRFDRRKYLQVCSILERNDMNTVCIESNCPNRYECFSRGLVTFLLLGNGCTRNCRYCNIKRKSKGFGEVDEDEPRRVGIVAETLGMKYVVLTSVTRDDLEDGGAEIITRTVKEIKDRTGACVEVLIPDFKGNKESLEIVISSNPDIISHNLETVERLFPEVRPGGSYQRSLELLKSIKEISPGMVTKSGIMVGLGESISEIKKVMNDLRRVECDILTIGQYLPPGDSHLKVAKFYTPEEFGLLKRTGKEMGFRHVEAGPMVRSSYMADVYGIEMEAD